MNNGLDRNQKSAAVIMGQASVYGMTAGCVALLVAGAGSAAGVAAAHAGHRGGFSLLLPGAVPGGAKRGAQQPIERGNVECNDESD